MSTAATRLKSTPSRDSLLRRSCGVTPLLEPTKADRGDSYGYHLKDFLNFAESSGMVTLDTIRDYFQELNGKPFANSTKRLMRQAVKARLRAAMSDGMDFNQAARFREALAKLDREVKGAESAGSSDRCGPRSPA